MKLLTTGLLACLSLPALASHPVLRTDNCQADITPPAGNNASYYLSKDCKTAYILPAEISPMKISGFQLGAGVRKDTCKLALKEIAPRLEAIDKQIRFQQQKLEQFQDQMFNALENATPEEKAELMASYDVIFKRIDSIMAGYKADAEREKERLPYSKWEGATVNIHLALDVAKQVNAYQEANKGKDIIFKAANISSGIISFTTSKDAASDVEYVTVLGAQVPGLSASGKDVFNVSKYIISNGGASGLVVLSQPSICEMVTNASHEKYGDNETFDKSVLTKDNIFESGFAANYIYDVPVTTNLKFSLVAASKPVDLFNTYTAKITKGEFTQNEVSNLLTSGELKNTVHVTFEDGGIPFDSMIDQIETDPRLNNDSDDIFGHLYATAMDSYLEMVLEKMKSLKMIQESVKNDPTPISGREAFHVRTVRKCRWKTSWGRTRKKCKNYQERDRYFIDGVATAAHVAQDNQTISFDFKVDAEQTLMMKHTTGFAKIKE